MSGWRDQFNSVSSNAFDFVQRLSNELTAESDIDPGQELDYYKQKSIDKDKQLTRCQAQLEQQNREIADLTSQVTQAYEEVEMTRQGLMNRIAAKELELERAKSEIDQLRDFNCDTTSSADKSREQRELELEVEVVKAEKMALSHELNQLALKLNEAEERTKEHSELLNQFSCLEKEVDQLRIQNNSLLKQLEGKGSDRPPQPENYHKVNVAELEQIEEKVETLQTEKERVEEQLASESNKRKEAEESLALIVSQYQRLAEEVEGLIDANSIIVSSVNSSSNGDLQNTVLQLEDKCSKAEAAKCDAMRECVTLQARIDELTSQTAAHSGGESGDSLKKETVYDANSVEQLHRRFTEVCEQCEKLQVEFSKSRGLLTKHQLLYNDVVQLVRMLSGEKVEGASDDTVVQIQTLIQDEQKKTADLKHALIDAESKMEQNSLHYQQVFQNLEEEVSQANNAVSELRKQLVESEQHLSQSLNEKSELESRVNELTAQIQSQNDNSSPNPEAEIRIVELENALKAMEESGMQQQQKAQGLEQKLLEVFVFVRSAFEENREELQLDLESPSFDNLTLHIRSIFAALKSNSNVASFATVEKDELIEKLTSEKQDVQARLDQTASQSLYLHQEIQSLRNQSVSLQEAQEHLVRENKKLSQEVSEAKQALHDALSQQKGLREGSAEAELFKMHAQAKLDKKQSELDQHTEELGQVRTELQFQLATLESLRSEKEGQTRLIHGLNETVRELQATYAETVGKLRKLQMDSQTQLSQLQTELEAKRKETTLLEEEKAQLSTRLDSLDATVHELKNQLDGLEDRPDPEPIPPRPDAPVHSGITLNGSGFVVPPVVRQFIISAVTCDHNKREESAMLLANIIGCTLEEKSQISQCYRAKESGWTSLFRGGPQPANGPKSVTELLGQFEEFLQRETISAAPVNAFSASQEPVRIEHEIEPSVEANDQDEDLKNIVEHN